MPYGMIKLANWSAELFPTFCMLSREDRLIKGLTHSSADAIETARSRQLGSNVARACQKIASILCSFQKAGPKITGTFFANAAPKDCS
jgi:hypothetical protein